MWIQGDHFANGRFCFGGRAGQQSTLGPLNFLSDALLGYFYVQPLE